MQYQPGSQVNFYHNLQLLHTHHEPPSSSLLCSCNHNHHHSSIGRGQQTILSTANTKPTIEPTSTSSSSKSCRRDHDIMSSNRPTFGLSRSYTAAATQTESYFTSSNPHTPSSSSFTIAHKRAAPDDEVAQSPNSDSRGNLPPPPHPQKNKSPQPQNVF